MTTEDKPRPVLYMLVGLPCTGKSTMIRDALLKEHDAVVLSTDDYVEEHAREHGISYNEAFVNSYGRARIVMDEKIREAVKADKSIVWDQTNLSKKLRRNKIKGIPKHYRKVAMVNMESDPDKLYKRMQEKRPNKVIPLSVLQKMADDLEMPSTDEGFDEIIVVKQDNIA